MELGWTTGLAFLAGIIAAGWFWWRERTARREAGREAARRMADLAAEISRAAQERQRWLAVTDATSSLMLTVDGRLQVVHANASAQAAFGPLAPSMSLIGYTHSLSLEELVSDTREGSDPQGLERVVSLRDRPHRARALAREGYVAIALEDVTEVQRLSRARQDLVANLSHELRTPLASLRLLSDTLASPMGEDPGVARSLAEKIVGEVETLNQMTQEMLDLAAIESGRQVIRLVPTPLEEILSIPVAAMTDQAARRGIRIESEAEGSVLADREQAQRAVLNVLHNAVKFSPDGGQVLLRSRTEPDQGRLVLSIEDSGPGIAPGDLERIFERFYRADEARGTPGTGLGLAIARHILRSHGGQIWAENRPPPNSGSVFHLAFSLA